MDRVILILSPKKSLFTGSITSLDCLSLQWCHLINSLFHTLTVVPIKEDSCTRTSFTWDTFWWGRNVIVVVVTILYRPSSSVCSLLLVLFLLHRLQQCIYIVLYLKWSALLSIQTTQIHNTVYVTELYRLLKLKFLLHLVKLVLLL